MNTTRARTHWLSLLKQTATQWAKGDVSTHAAGLAYFTVFSIAPTLVIAVALAGTVFGQAAARGEIQAQLQGLIGVGGAKAIEEMMANAARPGANVLASVIGVGVMLFGATGVFAALQNALNSIWHVKPPELNGVLSFLRTRFLSFAMVLGVGFLLLVSLVVSAGVSGVGTWLGGRYPGLALAWQVANFLVSFGVVTALFAMIYKVLPDVKVAWRDVWLGAAVTAVLFNIGKFLIGLYLGGGGVASTYGAAGSLAVLLIWVYYSSMVLFLGAQFTHVYAMRDAAPEPEPARGATPTGERDVQPA